MATPRRLKLAVTHFLRENALILATLLGILVGFMVGLGLQAADTSKDVLLWIGFPGELFFRGLKATIVPVIVCMVITATATVDGRSNSKMALVGVASFVVTTVLAVTTAVVLFLLLRPAANSLSPSNESSRKFSTKLQTQDVFLDLMRNIVPDNVVSAAFSQAVTVYKPEEETSSNASAVLNETTLTFKRSLGQTGGVNILGLITVCAAVGAAANVVLPRDATFVTFFKQGQEVILVVMRWLAWTTPVGVASLVAASIAGVDDLTAVFVAIGRLVICVISGLAIHQLIILPIILLILTRSNPFMYLVRCVKAYLVGFAACATSVAMPHMLEACDACGVSQGVSRFVIPMSVTLHADGSALYIASASLFLGQTSGQDGDLDLPTVLIIACLTSVLSLAIPPVPSASIVTVVIILTSLEYPLHGVALLFTVEWILDRLRSGLNATTHILCAVITQAVCSGGRLHSTSSPEVTADGRYTSFRKPEVTIDGQKDSMEIVELTEGKTIQVAEL